MIPAHAGRAESALPPSCGLCRREAAERKRMEKELRAYLKQLEKENVEC